MVLFVALFLADSLAVMIASSVSGLSRGAQGLASDPRVVVPAQGVAYLATVGFVEE